MSSSRPVIVSCYEPEALDWSPLEQFVAAATARRFNVTADAFMWMGRHDIDGGVVVHAYKHVDSRRYLNLDGQGHAYRDVGRRWPRSGPRNCYEPHASPRDAILDVIGDLASTQQARITRLALERWANGPTEQEMRAARLVLERWTQGPPAQPPARPAPGLDL